LLREIEVCHPEQSEGSQDKSAGSHRHTRESGYPEVFDFPGFRVTLAIASLPGMTPRIIQRTSETPHEIIDNDRGTVLTDQSSESALR